MLTTLVGEAFDKRRPRQDGPHHLPLHPDPASMDDPERPKAHAPRFFEILLDDGRDVPRRYRVQIEHVRDRDSDRLFVVFHPPLLLA